MLQINNSIRELLHKKKGCVLFLFFPGYPDFLVYTLLKTKYQNSGAGSMLMGV